MGLLDELRAATLESATNEGAGNGEGFAPSWRPETPDEGVEGIVVSRTKRVIENHPQGYPIVTIRQSNGEGELSIHAMQKVLMDEILAKDPQPGDELAVIYKGKLMGGNNREYKSFRVGVRKGGQVPQLASTSPSPSGPGPGDIPPF